VRPPAPPSPDIHLNESALGPGDDRSGELEASYKLSLASEPESDRAQMLRTYSVLASGARYHFSRKRIDPQFQAQYLSEVLLKYHKVQIIPQRSAKTLVTVRKRSLLSGQGITSPFIPRDQRRSYTYDRHANTMRTAFSGEVFCGSQQCAA
jgi:hypothetical protein